MQGIAYLHKDMKYRCIINLFLHKHCPDSCIIKYRNSDWQSDSLKRNQEVFIKPEKFPLSINWCHSVLRVCSLILDKQHHKSVTMKDVLIVNLNVYGAKLGYVLHSKLCGTTILRMWSKFEWCQGEIKDARNLYDQFCRLIS